MKEEAMAAEADLAVVNKVVDTTIAERRAMLAVVSATWQRIVVKVKNATTAAVWDMSVAIVIKPRKRKFVTGVNNLDISLVIVPTIPSKPARRYTSRRTRGWIACDHPCFSSVFAEITFMFIVGNAKNYVLFSLLLSLYVSL